MLRQYETREGGPQQGNALILIVEDNVDIRDFLSVAITEETPYQAHTASTGAQAWNILRQNTPDLFIFDYNLPDTTGCELISRLRNIHQFKDTPVILMSAYTSPPCIANQHNLVYMRKPLELEGFLFILQEILS